MVEAEPIPHVEQVVFVTGTQVTNESSKKAIQASVGNILANDGRIVVGAGVGSDVVAIKEALRIDPKRLDVFLVSDIDTYIQSRKDKKLRPEVTEEQQEQLDELIATLEDLKQSGAGIHFPQGEQAAGQNPWDIYDRLNGNMIRHAQSIPANKPPLCLYFIVGEGRGTKAAADEAKTLLGGNVYQGLSSENPYFTQK